MVKEGYETNQKMLLFLFVLASFSPIWASAAPDEVDEAFTISGTLIGTREDPLPIGTKWDTGDGWEVTVLEVIPDATQTILSENMFNDPPSSGNQFFLVKVKVCYTGDDFEYGSLNGESNFWAVGASNVAYNFENSCGVVPDSLPRTEIFRGGCVEGYVGWEIKSNDADSLLMYHHDYESHPRVYFSLVPNENAKIKTLENISLVETVSNLPPKINNFGSNKPSPQASGTSIIFTADALDPDGDPVYYRFWQNGPATGNIWRITKDWGITGTWIKSTSSVDIGNNQFRVWIRDGQAGHAGENQFDDEKAISFEINPPTTTTSSTTSTTASGSTTTSAAVSSGGPFVGSVNSNVYHYSWCASAKNIKSSNKIWFSTSADARSHGYRPCSKCHPP